MTISPLTVLQAIGLALSLFLMSLVFIEPATGGFAGWF